MGTAGEYFVKNGLILSLNVAVAILHVYSSKIYPLKYMDFQGFEK